MLVAPLDCTPGARSPAEPQETARSLSLLVRPACFSGQPLRRFLLVATLGDRLRADPGIPLRQAGKTVLNSANDRCDYQRAMLLAHTGNHSNQIYDYYFSNTPRLEFTPAPLELKTSSIPVGNNSSKINHFNSIWIDISLQNQSNNLW
jgi:hypothetical protein